jgi:hypothetical protein
MIVSTIDERRSMTPGQYARLHGISVNKVLAWIGDGSLRATNLATVMGRRPRWRLHPADIAAFEAARSNAPTVTPQRRRRRAAAEHTMDYFP